MSNLKSLEKKLREAKTAQIALRGNAAFCDDFDEIEKNKDIIKKRIWNLTVEIEELKNGTGE